MAHWKKAFNPDFLGAYSIEDGRDIIATIKSVAVEKITGEGGKCEDCLVCHFVEDIKPMILNKTNCKTISKVYKNPDTDSWQGKKIQIYATMTKFGREMVDCLRIRDKAPAEQSVSTVKCDMCGVLIQPAYGMNIDQFIAYSMKNTGKKMCVNCMKKLKEEMEARKNDGAEEKADN